MNESLNLTIDFEKAKDLYVLLRKNHFENSKLLKDLEDEVSAFLFNSMTIDEAEKLFNEC